MSDTGVDMRDLKNLDLDLYNIGLNLNFGSVYQKIRIIKCLLAV